MRCVCGKEIKGRKYTVMENILGEKTKNNYCPECFQKVVLGI